MTIGTRSIVERGGGGPPFGPLGVQGGPLVGIGSRAKLSGGKRDLEHAHAPSENPKKKAPRSAAAASRGLSARAGAGVGAGAGATPTAKPAVVVPPSVSDEGRELEDSRANQVRARHLTPPHPRTPTPPRRRSPHDPASPLRTAPSPH